MSSFLDFQQVFSSQFHKARKHYPIFMNFLDPWTSHCLHDDLKERKEEKDKRHKHKQRQRTPTIRNFLDKEAVGGGRADVEV